MSDSKNAGRYQSPSDVESPWKAIGRIAKTDVEPIKDRYFNKRKIWSSEEWRKKREGLVECEWCGDEPDTIQLHHKGHPLEYDHLDWYKVWDVIAYELFEEHGSYNASMERKSDLYMKHLVIFVQENRGLVAFNFMQEAKKTASNYINHEDLVPLCKSCHYAWENRGMRICGRCGGTYAPRRDDDELPDFACWDCVVELKGLEKCDCGNYYNPNEYERCSDCRIYGSMKVTDEPIETWKCTKCGNVEELLEVDTLNAHGCPIGNGHHNYERYQDTDS